MPSEPGLASHIMAVPAHICMYIIDMLVSVYNLFDRLTLKFEPQPPPSGADARRRRRQNPALSFGRRVVHFLLQLIELPVFLVVFIVTALLLSVLAVVEIVLGAILIKFRSIFLVALLVLGVYYLHVNGYLKKLMK